MRYSNFIRNDYKSREYLHEAERRHRHPVLRWLSLGLGLAVLGVVMANTSTPTKPEAKPQTLKAAINSLRLDLAIPGIAPETSKIKVAITAPANQPMPPILEDSDRSTPLTVEVTPSEKIPAPNRISTQVSTGDTLSNIFDRVGASHQDMLAVLSADKNLRTLYPGNELDFEFNAEQKLQRISRSLDETSRVIYTRNTEGEFKVTQHQEVLERRSHYAQGEILHSLFGAGKKAGISDNLIMDLAYIFGWDVDFALDVRKGDRFSLVYEKLYRDGEYVREGNILAAEFINQADVYRAIRFEVPDSRTDYFSPDGQTLRKAFLRSPLNFSRISSSFSLGRKHPILNKIRAHKGVDYAASRGTPIWSTGDGKIVFRGTKNGYGNTVIVNHGTRYSTLYAHLKGFGKGIRSGSRVKQGQTIGYVGSTGLATGPHLHYEFRVNGVHRNPLRMKFPGVAPIAENHKLAFELASAPLLAQLDSINRLEIAQRQD